MNTQKETHFHLNKFQQGLVHYKAREYDKALTCFETVAECGNTAAQFNLALMYRYGEGAPRDLKKAARWAETAAEHSYNDAQRLLKSIQKEQELRRRDPETAWMRLGQLVESGRWARGLSDFVCLDITAREGNADAQYLLGEMYWSINSGCIRHDGWQAAYWFEQAADQGHVEAQMSLAILLLNGDVIPKDRERAEYWLERTANQGHGQAKGMLERLRSHTLVSDLIGDSCINIEQSRVQEVLDTKNMYECSREIESAVIDPTLCGVALTNEAALKKCFLEWRAAFAFFRRFRIY